MIKGEEKMYYELGQVAASKIKDNKQFYDKEKDIRISDNLLHPEKIPEEVKKYDSVLEDE